MALVKLKNRPEAKPVCEIVSLNDNILNPDP